MSSVAGLGSAAMVKPEPAEKINGMRKSENPKVEKENKVESQTKH